MVQEITANVLLAAGAAPAMIVADEEVTPFAAISGAALINVGTLYPARLSAMRGAVAAANAAGVPGTLDPVAVGVLDYRSQACRDSPAAGRRRSAATPPKSWRSPVLPVAAAVSTAPRAWKRRSTRHAILRARPARSSR